MEEQPTTSVAPGALSPETHGAWLLVKERRFAPALSLVEGWLRDHPEDEKALLVSAICLDGLGRFEEAVYRSRRIGPGAGFVAALEVEARALISLGRLADARSAVSQILQAKPDHAWAHLRLAWIGLRTNDAVTALAAAERAVELRPNSSEALFVLASAHFLSGETRKASWGLRKVLALEPGNQSALKLQALVKSRRRRSA